MLLPCGKACFEKSNPFNPFNPCSFYQQSSFRTRIIKIFTDVIALRKLSVESVQSVFVLKVFVLPTEFFSNTDYKDYHGYYCLVACNSCLRRVIRWIRYIRVRFTNRVFRTRIIRMFTDVIALWQYLLEKIIRWAHFKK